MEESRPANGGLCEEDQDCQVSHFAKKIKTVEPATLAKNIVSILIEAISAGVSILVKNLFVIVF